MKVNLYLYITLQSGHGGECKKNRFSQKSWSLPPRGCLPFCQGMVENVKIIFPQKSETTPGDACYLHSEITLWHFHLTSPEGKEDQKKTEKSDRIWGLFNYLGA